MVVRESLDRAEDDPPVRELLIIGTGFAGLAMAIQAREAGVDDLVMLERAGEVGGTWRDNDYPGCACDVQSHLYSLSFAQKRDWTRTFAGHAEIQAYILDCYARYGLRPKVRLDADIVRAQWDAGEAVWTVTARDGRRWRGRALVSAIGALSNPAIPKLPGLEDFAGKQFHSATWDHDYALEGRRVAVVGTGASAIQFVPQIAPKVARLHLFQRTAPWVLPKADRPFGRIERAAYAHVPGLQAARRARIYWGLESRVLGFAYSQALMKATQNQGLRHIRRGIRDPQLRAKVTPNFTLGCKRVLLSNDYYPALDRANVEVVDAGVEAVTATGIVDARGVEREVDTIIFGTGFRVQSMVPEGMIFGRGGVDLAHAWSERMTAYKGTTVPGFPNLFVLAGPNTGLGHSSMVFMLESQVRYVVDALVKMRDRKWASVEVRSDRLRAFVAGLDDKAARAVWSSGCRSWYLDRSGNNTALWPDFTFRFRQTTASFDEQAYAVQTLAELAELAATASAGDDAPTPAVA
ncbi:flavin-containing monooxygenase [Plesiocystis pacifica]|uniref:flavin-containing monooxygenase n=1 Tax=Plesiocystis pacifica TaxID=191768 RepID=UPI0005D4757D|nr:NAD(P)/FAD-dependent oxidoreductase [Plesiocystis pacifica]